MDRNMTIKGLAELLGVDEMTVSTWERDIHTPPPRLYAKIIRFIGYFPFAIEGLSFGKQIYYARQVAGITQKQLGQFLNIDVSNLRSIELDQQCPSEKNRILIKYFIDFQLTYSFIGKDVGEYPGSFSR